MRDRGRFTSLQGQTLKDRLDERVGTDTEALTIPTFEHSAVRRPGPQEGPYDESETIVDDPTQESLDDIMRDFDRDLRRPAGDT